MKLLIRTCTLLVMVALLLLAATPAFAQVTVSKSAISYGSILVSVSKVDSFYVKSQIGYQISSVTTGTSQFVVLGNPTGIIADSMKVRVQFTPSALGTFVDTVVVVHSGPNSPLKVTLTGTGISGLVLKSPRTGGTLATLAVVDTFAARIRFDSLTILNTTSTAFSVSALTVANPEFKVLTTLPIPVGALDSAKVRFSYQGTAVGRDIDTLFIVHNHPTPGSSPLKLVLSGRAISHIRIGYLNGTTRVRYYDNLDTVRVTAANAGNVGIYSFDPKIPVDSARLCDGIVASLLQNPFSLINPVDTIIVRIDSIKFTGPHFYNITPTPYLHRPGDQYDRGVKVIYQPKNVSSPIHRDTMVIYTDDPVPGGNRLTLLVEAASRNDIYLRSRGANRALGFGNVGLGATVDSVMRIHNFQDVALRVDSVTLLGKNPKYRIVSPTTGFTVNKGDTGQVTVRYVATDTLPNLAATIADTVLVYTNFSATPARLPLSAKTVSTIVYFPAITTVPFGQLTVGLFKDSTLKVFNRTATAFKIDSISLYSGRDYFLLSNVLTTQLPAGDSTAIQIRFKPVGAGFTRDTMYIWHTWTALGINRPTKIVLTGTGTTQALISPSDYVTVDNVRGIDGFAIASPDSSYAETTINGFYTNASTVDYGGTATGHRRSPNLSGSANGSSARYTFRIDSTSPYLIYHYIQSSANMGLNLFVHLRKFGVGGIVDSVRYDQRTLNYTNYSPEGGGSWYPLMMHQIEGVGPRAASITIGADALSSPFLRVDAVRFLRSRQKADLEFGRRSFNFLPVRVPEEYGQVTIGDEYGRNIRLYNLGRDTLAINDISFYPTNNLQPVPWFFAKNYTKGTTLKIPPMTVGTDGKETGGWFDLNVAMIPYQEGTSRDSMVISSNDENEPKAYNILYAEGLNYNFIMNASSGNTEPHYNAPGPPDVPTFPLYRENANGSWLNSTAAAASVPVMNTNLSSRVNTGGATTFPHLAWYEFQLPEIYKAKIPLDGRYILECGLPAGSSNAYSNTQVKVTHTFGVPPDSVSFDSRTVGLAAPFWVQIGGSAKTWFLAPGGKITVEWARNSLTDAAGGIGFLRTDLMRVRKVPTGALIGVNIPLGATIGFGDVSFRTPAGVDGKANRKDITIASRGESQIIVRSVRFRDGRYFKILGTLPTTTSPLYLRALVGEQTFTITFVPDRIASSFLDTLEVLSNSVRDSVLRVPVIGNGIGGIYAVDDDGSVQEVSSTPAFGGLFLNGWDKTKMNNWQLETSNVADSIGRGKTRRLAPIYFNGGARFEWYPQIPQSPGEPDSVLMNVAVTVPRGYAKAAPRARYKVFSTGGNITKDTLINQNSSVTTGASRLVELNLGNHWFLRGGRDIAGGQAFFGHVRLENDTAAVSAYYGSTTNFARRDTFGLLADALILREVDRLQPSVTGVKDEMPLQFALSQNYPNPFNPTTTIEFSLARTVPVELKIYDLLGREVAVLLNGDAMNPGRYMLRWDGRNRYGQSVATGVYFYRIVAGDFVQSKKMVLVK